MCLPVSKLQKSLHFYSQETRPKNIAKFDHFLK